jgi:ribose transport system ATP-binding protein
MRRLAARGISIIYISHRMAEIFDNCDRVTVLRDGRYVTTRAIADTTPSDIVGAMVGRVIDSLYPQKMRKDEASDEIILDVRGLSDGRRLRDISLNVRKGEILGLGGLIGAGRSEIARGICGLDAGVTGHVVLNGKPLSIADYRDSIDAGMVYLSEDRKADGLFLDMSIAANVSALAIDDVASPIGIIDDGLEAERAERLGQKLGVKCAHVRQPVSALSGGNQQKVAIAKMLSVEPGLVFLDEPTRGVDVGAKAEIHRILRDLARSGVGVVVISSELPELIGLCDRVIVVREGRIAGEVSGEAMTEQRIMHLASIADEGPRAS